MSANSAVKLPLSLVPVSHTGLILEVQRRVRIAGAIDASQHAGLNNVAVLANEALFFISK
jgi:hypothetical protein